jgi:MoaA/NifB/PqqE/SkfB family radical SAM enzyme
MLALDQITSLIIEPTAYCNLHCPQCPRFDADGFLTASLTPAHLDPDVLAKNLDLNLLPNLKEVKLEGDYGDVMMHPRPTKFLDIFSRQQINAVTNGSMRNTKFWAGLARYKNLTVTFSIDGLVDTNHVYRLNSDWKVIMANASAFINAGGQAVWKFIVFRHNEHQVDEAKELAKQLGFTDFVTQHTNRSWFSGNVWPVKIDGIFQYNIEPSTKSDLELGFSLGQKTGALYEIKKSNGIDNIPSIVDNCFPRRRRSMYINHLGHLLPCCMTSALPWGRDIQSQMWRKIVGDVDSIDLTKNTLSSIEQSPFYQENLQASLQSNRKHPVCIASCTTAKY